MSKFYKTVIHLVVLTDDGPIDDAMTLGELEQAMAYGGATGNWSVFESEKITPEQMRKELDAVGTDHSFFGLDDLSPSACGKTFSEEDDKVQVVFHTETQEGWNGDYDPHDPEDDLLYRFDINYKEGDKWVPVDNGSYCTALSAEVTENRLKDAIKGVFNEVKDLVKNGISVKKVAEKLSWVGTNRVEV